MLRNVLEKISALSFDDAELMQDLAVAKIIIEKAINELNIPKKIDIWNGSYSCPTCGHLYAPVELCDDDYKQRNYECSNCKQKLDWELNLVDGLSLLDLKRIVDTACLKECQPESIPVLIDLNEPLIGARASERIVAASMGFDWESGEFRLSPKRNLIHEK